MVSSIISRTDGLVGDSAYKAPVKVASTAALILSGEQTIDGVAVSQHFGTSQPPDRVLVKDQSDQTQNGIYSVQLGAWLRAADFDGPYDVANGTQVLVTSGNVHAGQQWRVTTPDPVEVDGLTPSNITFAQVSSGAPSGVTTIAGSVSGNAYAQQDGAGRVVVTLVAYRSTAKSYTYPTPFGHAANILWNVDPPASTSLTVLTLPDSSAAAIDGVITVEGN